MDKDNELYKPMTVTPNEIMEAGGEALAMMVHKNPMAIVLTDELTSAIALTIRILVKSKEEK